MAYTSNQASETLDRYLKIKELGLTKTIIDNTKNRGFLLVIPNGEKVVIFTYPLVHKQDNTKNYFDTRDSGPHERTRTWDYALTNHYKYFCLGVNEQVEKYKDYVFSLECDEQTIESLSGTVGGDRSSLAAGNQIIIPNNYVPQKKFERIQNNLGTFISVIHISVLYDYLEKYDNRPYMYDYKSTEIGNKGNAENSEPESIGIDGEKKNTPHIIKFYTGLVSTQARNRIIFGAPGTGKSYQINLELRLLLKDGGRYERVTFHPDYSYANFVGTYKPVPYLQGDGQRGITYEYVPGPFSRVLVEALKNSTDNCETKPHVLVVEEINRANMAAVFGDVFQLLDRNDLNVSEYPIHVSDDMKKYLAKELGGNESDYNEIRLPDNLFIWATMNSADQGVFPMDTAFKRRWDFTYLSVDANEEKIKDAVVTMGIGNYMQKISWNELRKAINSELLKFGVNEDKLMGTFFVSKKVIDTINNDGGEQFRRVFKNKVLMYLFDDAAKRKASQLFSGCANNKIYSEILREFDRKGIEIFMDDIRNKFRNIPKGTFGAD